MSLSVGNSYFTSQTYMQSILAKADKGSSFEAEIKVAVSTVTATEDPAPQTIDDVKKEFYDYLDSLAISPSLARTPLSVNIPDAAFEKMLADPEYKQKMKDLCARDLCDPAWTKMPPSGINITIDADCEEEYLATSYNSPDGAKNVNEDGFWTRRAKKKKEEQEILEEKAQEKREMMAFLQERADERKRVNKEFFASAFSGQGIAAYAAPGESVSGESVISSLL